MSINRNHLALFQAVAEEGSFGRGAQRMHISQPAVSKQVAQLEASLGLKLLDRLPRGVRMTAAGQKLLTYAQRIAELERRARREMDQLRGLEAGKLAVGASTTIGIYLLPEVLGVFSRAYPGIELTLEVANTRAIAEKVASMQLDVGLTEGTGEAVAEIGAVDSRMFHQDELVVIAPPGHPLCMKRRVLAADLRRYPMLMREPGSGTRAVIEAALDQRELVISRGISMGSTEAIKRAVAAGMGIAIVSRLTVLQEVTLGRLAVVPVKDLTIRRPLHRLRPRASGDDKVVQIFETTLAEALARSDSPRPAASSQALTWSI